METETDVSRATRHHYYCIMISVVAITVMIFSLSNECLIGTKKPKLGGGQEKREKNKSGLKFKTPTVVD